MFLESVEGHNFLSFEEVHRDFSKDKTGLTLIEGRNLDEGDGNGAGKSGVWDIISWVTCGETIRGIKGDDVVHRKFKKDCSATVKFQAKGKHFEVTRFRRHTGRDDNGLFGNRFQVIEDGKVIEKGSVDATQKWLLETIGLDFELLRCTMIFGQGDTFNFVNETDKKQKEILSKIRRLNLTKALEKARIEMREIESSRSEISRKIEVLRSHLIDNPKDAFSDEIAGFEKDRRDQLSDITKSLEVLQADIDKMEESVGSVEALSDEEDKIKKVIAERQAKIDEMHRKYKDPRREAVAVIGSRLKVLNSINQVNCPTCDRPIDEVLVKKECKHLQAKSKVLAEALVKINEAIEKLSGEIDILKNKLDVIKSKKIEARLYGERLYRLKAEVIKNHDDYSKVENRMNPWLDKKSQAISKQKDIKSKMKDFANELSPLVAREPYLKFWGDGFSDKGLKSFIFDSICSTLTAKANHYLSILSGGAVSITFDTQTRLKTGEYREKFECLVISDGEAVPYAAYSGGEKTRISLSVDMALADLMSDSYGTEFNVVVFDEQDMFLDRQGRQYYLQLLKERAKTQQVFVVAHDAEFKGMFDKSWTIEKRDRVSYFV